MLRSLAIHAVMLGYRVGRPDTALIPGRWAVALLTAAPHVAVQLAKRVATA